MTTISCRRAVLLGTAVAATLGLAACGSAPTAAPTSALAPAADAQRLAGVCPADVQVQLQWQPQSDMGGLFQLLGPGYTVDTAKKTVTGPLVAGGKDTGVRLTLRAGGGAIGFNAVATQMYADPSIDLGLVHGDQMVTAAAAGQAVVGVTPLLTYSPAMLMWDPATHPDWTGVSSIGASGATVVVSKEQTFPDWLVQKGMLKAAQLDTSYDGAPARFVADPQIAQQGFANSEPFTYEHDTPAWNRPVKYQLLKDVGYEVYASNVSVRADKLAAMGPCLAKLVPIIQQGTADYVAAPGQADATIVDVVGQDATMFPYTAEEAAYSAKLLKDAGLIANGPDGAVGTYDMARVQRTIAQIAPVVAEQTGKPSTVTAEQLVTNQFTDRSIALR